MPTSRLYYEAHITADATGYFSKFSAVVGKCGWRASLFDEDGVDNYHGKFFASFRDVDLDATKAAIREVKRFAEEWGYKVIRWKVEDTVLDSKHGDTL